MVSVCFISRNKSFLEMALFLLFYILYAGFENIGLFSKNDYCIYNYFKEKPLVILGGERGIKNQIRGQNNDRSDHCHDCFLCYLTIFLNNCVIIEFLIYFKLFII